MGQFIVSDSIASVANNQITARSNTAGYPKINVMNFWHLGQSFRAADITATAYLLDFDFGSAVGLTAVMLNDVNFDHVQIIGDADAAFTPAYEYDSGSLHPLVDPLTGRGKIWITTTAFNSRYMRIYIPAGTVVLTGTTPTDVWKIGTVVLISSMTTLAVNPLYGYQRKVVFPYEETVMRSGNVSRIASGDLPYAVLTMSFGVRTLANESELWGLNSMGVASPMVIYENGGDVSKCYLCVKDTDFEGSFVASGLVQGTTLQFRELV